MAVFPAQPSLPAQPNLDHLRRQARDLLRAARAGDASAAGRLRAVSDRLTLTTAQLAVAREYGFASWAALRIEVDARVLDLARQAEQFCQASIGDWTGRAVRMLAARPELAFANLATAVVLGDADRVRRALEADPGLATRPDPRTGWTPLHAVCASRWHQLDPARADGLTAVARLLVDAGADVGARTPAGAHGGWSPLRCAVAGAANAEIAELLLERGALPDDDCLYLSGFAQDDHRCLRLLLQAGNTADLARMALAAPISSNDTDGVRLLLEAGADPRRYLDDDQEPTPAAYAAVRSGCGPELVELLLAHGADPGLSGSDGRSPYALAVRLGRADLAEVLRRHGARDDASDLDRLLSACLLGDGEAAASLLARQPSVLTDLTQAQRASALIQAAETGNLPGMRLMLDLGFEINARDDDNGATALHAAGHAGSSEVTRLLIERGADLEARDTRWDSTPVVWAVIGSGEQPPGNPAADWLATVRILIEAGARVEDISLGPDEDDPKPPSPAVIELLRCHNGGPEDRR
jgi:ankyrin repeat protein